MESQEQAPTPAGWYPDPDQPATQRFWDGEKWTSQRVPLPEPATRGAAPSTRSLAGAAGGLAAAVGVFLPRVDSPTSLHIADNSVIATEVAVGVLVLLLAAGGALAAIQDQYEGERNPWLLLAGLLIVGAAIYYGTGDRLDLVTSSPTGFLAGKEFTGSPGVGLYLMGAGGLLMALAGALYRGADQPRA